MAATDTIYNLTEFGDQSHRFSVESNKNINRLTISATMWEDIGMYYCGAMYLRDFKFGQGTFLMIKGIHSVISLSDLTAVSAKSEQNANENRSCGFFFKVQPCSATLSSSSQSLCQSSQETL